MRVTDLLEGAATGMPKDQLDRLRSSLIELFGSARLTQTIIDGQAQMVCLLTIDADDLALQFSLEQLHHTIANETKRLTDFVYARKIAWADNEKKMDLFTIDGTKFDRMLCGQVTKKRVKKK